MSDWKPGDEANGHRLNEGGQWVAIEQSGPPPASNPPAPNPPKKKRRIFLWVFLTIQVLFIIWIIAGASGGAGTPEDCASLSEEACNAASDVGTGIGVFLVFVFWVIVDFILAVTYGIYRLAKRS